MTTLYVRHRDRMVQESVFEDLANTLVACRWISGTSTRPVISPYDLGAGYQVVTTDPSEVLALLEGDEVTLIDYFPEVGNGTQKAGVPETGKTEPNTLAVDTPSMGSPTYVELGSNLTEQPYTFAMAFYAVSDGVALAVLNDLRDRYMGRIVSDDYLDLFDYNNGLTDPVTRMQVETFRFGRNQEAVAPHEVHLYYAELELTDFVDAV